METPKTKARLYCKDTFYEGAVLLLTQPQSHYLKHVLRVKLSDHVRVFNGRDGEWLGEITDIAKKEVSLTLVRSIRPQIEPTPLGLIFAPIRHHRLDFMIEKATELGVTDFYPIKTDFTQVGKLNEDRLHLIAIEAAEQSEQLHVATIHPMKPLAIFLQDHPDLTIGFCDETGMGKPLTTYKDTQIHAFLIGPEGGFSPGERTLLRSFVNVIGIHLGPSIIRAETAAIAVVAGWHAISNKP